MLTAKQFKSRMTSNKKPFYIPKTDIELMTEFAKYCAKQILKQVYLGSQIKISDNHTNEKPLVTDSYDDGFFTITIDKLDITVEEFASKIESMTEKRAFVLLSALLDGDEVKIEKAKRIFNNVKITK